MPTTMLNTLRTKIRALINDISKNDYETFEYSTSTTFKIAQENITINSVLLNEVELGSGEYSFSSDTNKITITADLDSGDNEIEVNYTYYKYSDTELTEYIRASLVWISIFSFCSTDFEIEGNEIYPTPDNKMLDLISLVASILIKPNYNEYRLPNLVVKYPKTMPKEQRIEKLVRRFNSGIGSMDLLEWS
ncbi:MAG: hypothetical protein ACTSXT_01350 [Candidatus Helarchaeota archaeon]